MSPLGPMSPWGQLVVTFMWEAECRGPALVAKGAPMLSPVSGGQAGTGSAERAREHRTEPVAVVRSRGSCTEHHRVCSGWRRQPGDWLQDEDRLLGKSSPLPRLHLPYPGTSVVAQFLVLPRGESTSRHNSGANLHMAARIVSRQETSGALGSHASSAGGSCRRGWAPWRSVFSLVPHPLFWLSD